MLTRLARASVLAWFGLGAAGCGSGGGVLPAESVLRLDQSDLTSAPILAPATYEAAARFTPALTAPLAGNELTRAEFWIEQVPAACTVKLYGPGGASGPGALLYSADVTADLVPGAWNVHVLSPALIVPDTDLWISVAFTNAVVQPTIGCDFGPLQADGDWLYSSDDATWLPYSQRVGSSVNWSIKGVVTLP